jgi:zinc protease
MRAELLPEKTEIDHTSERMQPHRKNSPFALFYKSGVVGILVLLLLLPVPAAQASPKIQHWTLKNGVRVYFVEAHDLPMVQLRAVFDAGSSRDPAGREGLALMTARMLREGTGALNADDIASRFEGLGAEFGASSDRDTTSVDLRSLTDRALLDPAIELFAQILAKPAFPADALDRERARSLVALSRDAQSPGAVIEKAFYHELYGSHPYGNDPLGTEAGIRVIRREDLANQHGRYFAGRNAWLVMVGDLKRGEAEKLAEKALGSLSAGEPAPKLAGVTAVAGHVRSIAFPAQQSHIRLGLPVMTRDDPDYFALHVGNYILGGGGLVSRLADEVREKRGYAYSVYSYFLPMRAPGPFVLGLQTKNTQRADALKLVRRVLAEFVEKGPSDKEMDAAKKHLTGAFPLRLDSNRKIADNLAVIAFYGLPLTWLDEYNARVEAVTVEQIRDAFRRRLPLDKLTTVTLGG